MTRQILIETDARSRAQGSRHQHGGMLPRRATCLTVVLAIAGLAIATPSSYAADISWSGASNVSWSVGANWFGGVAPVNGLTGDTVVFNSAAYANQPTTGNARAVRGITIGADSGGLTLTTSGGINQLQVGSGGVTMASGAATATLGTITGQGLRLGANQTWTNDSASLLTVGSVTNQGNGSWTVTLGGSGAGGFTIIGSIQNNGASTNAVVVDYAGSGTVTFSGSSSFTGGLTLKQGRISGAGVNDTLGAGTATFGFNSGTSSIAFVSGSSSTGRTQVAPIVLAQGHTGSITIGSLGGNVTYNGGVTGTNNLIVEPQSGTMAFSTAGLNYTGNLTKNGVGTLSLAAANTLSGTTLVNSGTLRLDHVSALQNATLDTGTSGSQAVTFNVSGTNTYTLGGLQGSDALAIGDNTISVGGNNASTAFSGSISGSGGLTKTGTGVLALAGGNLYSGSTTVSAGTLLVNGNQSGALGAVSVAAGAILGGTGTLGAASAAITGTVAPGLSDALGTLSVAGSAMNFSSGGSLLAQLNSNPAVFTSDLLSLTGAGSLTLGGSSILDLVGPAAFTTSGTYTLATFASGSLTGQFTTVRYNGTTFANPTNPNAVNSGGTLVYNGDSIQFVVVPEPATLVLAGLGVGLAGLMLKHRRRPL